MALPAMVFFVNYRLNTGHYCGDVRYVFGKGLARIGFAVVIDTAPPRLIGVAGALFGAAGNVYGIVTPITIGYLFAATHAFSGAISFVAAHGVIAALSYLFMVGKLKQLQLPKHAPA
jgi:ACS family glucarate transporter-like MFS transporter